MRILLTQTFNLRQAYVLANPPDNQDLLWQRLGSLGARCLQNHLHDGIKIGLGSGTTVHQVVRAMPRVELKEAKVVQISGALGSGNPVFDGPNLRAGCQREVIGQLSCALCPTGG
ncbi:MAG: hypothetical protein HS114_14515 [Anaerolineales bacterium]|nr:hypothetical protein [Anaerolineales bacterium]